MSMEAAYLREKESRLRLSEQNADLKAERDRYRKERDLFRYAASHSRCGCIGCRDAREALEAGDD